MSIYQVTIHIDSETRPERLRDFVDRMLKDWFGSSGTVDNVTILDPDTDPETWESSEPTIGSADDRSIADEAIDEHNEAVARAAGARSYTRTDGQKIVFDKPRISTGWETINRWGANRMTRYRGKSGTYYQSQTDAAYAFDLEED